MNEPEIINPNDEMPDTISKIVARLRDGYDPAATALERHLALEAYFGKVSEIVCLLQDATSHRNGCLELEIAQRSLALTAREVGLYREGLQIDLYKLDRAAFLLSLSETLVASLCVAEVLNLDVVGALNCASEHLRVQGNPKGVRGNHVREAKVCLPFAKLVMRDYI